MMRLRGRFALLVATAAVLPLFIFGLVSVGSLRTGTRQSVMNGNMLVATRAGEQIEQYFDHAVRTLQALAADLQGTKLAPWQQERILRNYVLVFPSFREIALFDRIGHVVATSRLVASTLAPPPATLFDERGVAISPVTVDDDLLPRTTVGVQVMPGTPGSDVLVAEMRLEDMWRLVDRLRIGAHGYALLVDREGRLIAHGNPDEKARVARGEDLRGHPLAEARGAWPARPVSLEYRDSTGHPMLGTATPLPSLSWTLVVEQPTDEAFGLLNRLEAQLLAAIIVALLATVGFGYFWGRSFIAPITSLLDGTRALSEGKLETRVRIDRKDEFGTLGAGFNSMADRLSALQDAARRQERQAILGRIAAGLVHDLSHPIQNIGNNARLILKMHDDPEYRETFRRTVERELQTIKRLFEDLRNLARPIPLERFPIDLGRSVGDAVENMRTFADNAGLTLVFVGPAEPVAVEGDVFALGRVYRNVILNAIQATNPGGEIRVAVDAVDSRGRIRISDTGCGIPPERLAAIFEDFATTKRRGLGLGLPISRKIVEQLGGSIAVASVAGEGTTVTIEFPLTTQQPLRPAEGVSAS